MLSTAYRLRLEGICKKIANKEEVQLDDMIWAEKLAKSHTLARDWLKQARRQAAQDIEEGSTDDFLNRMGLGDPDPPIIRFVSLKPIFNVISTVEPRFMIGWIGVS